MPGMLAKEYMYAPLGNIKTYWGYLTFLGLMVDQLCLGESIADSFVVASLSGESFHYCLTLGELRYLGHILHPNLPWYLGGQSN